MLLITPVKKKSDNDLVVTTELTHSKTIPPNSLKIKSQPAFLEFRNLT